MNHIKIFEEFGVIDDFKKSIKSEFSKKGKSQRIIKDILKSQGTKIDQRRDRKIYTEEELNDMTVEEIMSIYRTIHHPQGRNW